MAKVQFFKGTYEQITGLASRVVDGIYVATDKPFIFVGDQKIGIDGSVVKTFEWNDASNALKVSYVDGSEKVVVVPIATAEKNGLMSKEDFTKLSNINANWFGSGHTDADRIVWTVDISAFATKEYVDASLATKIDEAGVLAILDSSLAPYAKTEDVSANFVAKNGTDRLMTADEGTKLEGIAAGAQVNAVEGVVDDEKIISLDSNKKLKSTLTINYDSSSRKVQLKGIDSTLVSEFDASEFVKDGMLYGTATGKSSANGTLSVTIKTQQKTLTGLTPNHQYLVFCFTDGAVTPTYDWQAIDVEHLVDVYKAGTAIEITADNSINVKVGEDTSVNKNFLDVVDNMLEVREIDADCTKTTESVQVLGGPLASQVTNWPSTWVDASGNKVVPANLSMQDFILGLYFKELFGTVSKGSYTWSPSIAQPNAALSSTSTQEVGATLTATYSKNDTVSGNTRKVTVSQDAQGFGIYVGDTYQSGNKEFSKAGSTSGTNAVDTATWNGTAIASGDSVTTVEGTNTLYVKQSGLSATMEKFSGESICYGATNQKKKNENSSVDVNESSDPANKTLSNNKSVTVTAYYPIYSNGADSNTGDTTTPTVTRAEGESHKHPLTADNTQFGVAFAAMTAGGEGYRLCIQKDKSITYAYALNGLTSKYDIDVKAKFVKSSSTTTKTTGATTAEYYVWEYTGTEGANRVNFKID